MPVFCDVCTTPLNPDDESIYTEGGGALCEKHRQSETQDAPPPLPRTVMFVPHGYRWTNSNTIQLIEVRDRINQLASHGADQTKLKDLWTFREIIEALMFMEVTPTATAYICEERKDIES